jgi:hypothetical protein
MRSPKEATSALATFYRIHAFKVNQNFAPPLQYAQTADALKTTFENPIPAGEPLPRRDMSVNE